MLFMKAFSSSSLSTILTSLKQQGAHPMPAPSSSILSPSRQGSMDRISGSSCRVSSLARVSSIISSTVAALECSFQKATMVSHIFFDPVMLYDGLLFVVLEAHLELRNQTQQCGIGDNLLQDLDVSVAGRGHRGQRPGEKMPLLLLRANSTRQSFANAPTDTCRLRAQCP
ncbi:hypothetical protein EYF80_007810 [Liparis tanakae]|uniref:Uncharacterized protein n=1 Tax=Liparis tanakae TaxID=230148 RepID=A0A4Z2IX81_9TELE|nr:hypothetical protein EYF80_007810 [Liparis tanakae]